MLWRMRAVDEGEPTRVGGRFAEGQVLLAWRSSLGGACRDDSHNLLPANRQDKRDATGPGLGIGPSLSSSPEGPWFSLWTTDLHCEPKFFGYDWKLISAAAICRGHSAEAYSCAHENP